MVYRRWHRVLGHALLGVDPVDLGEQDVPDLGALAAALESRRPQVEQCRVEAAASDRPWPVPPSDELAEGLPWSQYATALHQLRVRLGLLGPAAAPARGPVTLDREGQRLVADRPPHW